MLFGLYTWDGYMAIKLLYPRGWEFNYSGPSDIIYVYVEAIWII
jgi:hypothetical protein